MMSTKKKTHKRNKKNASISSDAGSLVHKKNSVSVDKSDMALMMEGGSCLTSNSQTP